MCRIARIADCETRDYVVPLGYLENLPRLVWKNSGHLVYGKPQFFGLKLQCCGSLADVVKRVTVGLIVVAEFHLRDPQRKNRGGLGRALVKFDEAVEHPLGIRG